MKTLNIKEIFKDVWSLFEKNVFVLVGAYAILALLIIGPGIIMDEQGMVAVPEGIIASLIALIVAFLLSPGLIRILLDIAEKKEVKINTLWSMPNLAPHYLALKVLQAVIIFLGFILFFFPAVIFWIMFSFASFAFIKREGGILEALVESKNVTRGYKWQLLLVFILLSVLNILGALLYGVGLIVTVPFSHLAIAYLYTKLRADGEAELSQ